MEVHLLEHKRCSRCLELRAATSFPRHSSGNRGKVCGACARAAEGLGLRKGGPTSQNQAVNREIYWGRMHRPSTCELCGCCPGRSAPTTRSPRGRDLIRGDHFAGPAFPLVVAWICLGCDDLLCAEDRARLVARGLAHPKSATARLDARRVAFLATSNPEAVASTEAA